MDGPPVIENYPLPEIPGEERKKISWKKLDAETLKRKLEKRLHHLGPIPGGKKYFDDDAHNTAHNFPPYDIHATKPEGVYPLDKIILPEEWPCLKDLLYQKTDDVYDAYPLFVRNRLHKLENIQDEMKKGRLAGVLSYITHLIRFKDLHSMDGGISAKENTIPPLLCSHFESTFGGSNLTTLQPEKKQMLVRYVLVLSLIADEFQSDPSDIAMDLKMTQNDVHCEFGCLGCYYKRVHSRGFIFFSKLPLRFPLRNPKPMRMVRPGLFFLGPRIQGVHFAG